MKIVVINGTPIKGVTYYFKETFLMQLPSDCEIKQFYPSDIPEFCLGCKNCFFKGEDFCPHKEKIEPLRMAIFDSDVIVFAYPSYALNAPSSIKSLLDHLCVNWMVHRPEEKMFHKKAVILTNSIGMAMQQKLVQKTVRIALSWMGVSKIYSEKLGLMGDIDVENFKPKTIKKINKKVKHAAKKILVEKPLKRKSFTVALKFKMCKIMHKCILKTETIPSLDNQHFIDRNWIKPNKKKK